MDYRIIIVISALALVFEKIDATAAPGTGIPTLFPPTTTTHSTTPAPTFPTTTKVTSATSTTPLMPITCFDGSCDTSLCSNSSFSLATVKCGSSIHTCVTEITPGIGGKQYNFRCGRTNCTVEKTSANNGTDVLCCNQASCNTIEAVLLPGNTGASIWAGVTTLVAGMMVFLQLCEH